MVLPGGETTFIGDGGLETYVDEAIGIVRAAGAAGVPVSISFTVETDGRLPDGEPLAAAVQRLDRETAAAAYLMVPSLSLLGGCCRTDARHLAAICSACLS